MESIDEKPSEIETGVHHRSLFEVEEHDPATELVHVVAELKAVNPTDLEPLYNWADDLIDDLYSSPPPAAAQSVVEFSYEGFRITLHQDGHAVFMNRSTDH